MSPPNAAAGPEHPGLSCYSPGTTTTRRAGGKVLVDQPYCSPLGILWGSTPQSSPHSHQPRMMATNASSISRPCGTVGWLWNLRSEQGSWTIHAAPRWPGTHQPPPREPAQRASPSKPATRMLHWTTRIPVNTRTTTAWLPLLQLLYEPGRTHNVSPSQLKVSSTIDGTSSNPKPSTGKDKSQDGPTRTSHRPTSTALFQSCRFSTNQDMSQDGPTRMGATGPTQPLPKLAAPLRTELWREALRRG